MLLMVRTAAPYPGRPRCAYTQVVGESEWRKEVLRINARYLSEVVEQFDLCPWAKSVRNTAKLHRVVYSQSADAPGLLSRLAKDIEDFVTITEAEIGLLILPNFGGDNGSFRSFVASLEAAHAEAHPRHDIPLAMASFHPRAKADLSSPARLVSFIRRSPDPTIQLVRRESMAKVRQGSGGGSMFAESLEAFLPMMGKKAKLSVSDGIAQSNLETVERMGIPALEAILNDIAEDRETSYRQTMAL